MVGLGHMDHHILVLIPDRRNGQGWLGDFSRLAFACSCHGGSLSGGNAGQWVDGFNLLRDVFAVPQGLKRHLRLEY